MRRKIWMQPKFAVSTADQEDLRPSSSTQTYPSNRVISTQTEDQTPSTPIRQPQDPPPLALQKSASVRKNYTSPPPLPNLRPEASQTSSITDNSDSNVFNESPSLSRRSVQPQRLEIGEQIQLDSDDEREFVEQWNRKPRGRPKGSTNKAKIYATPIATGDVVEATAAPDASYREEQLFYSPSPGTAMKTPDLRRVGVDPNDRSNIQGQFSSRLLGKPERDFSLF